MMMAIGIGHEVLQGAIVGRWPVPDKVVATLTFGHRIALSSHWVSNDLLPCRQTKAKSFEQGFQSET